MKILLTGGAGFIGSHVADLLISTDHTVTIIDDLSTGKKENIPDAARHYHISITDPAVADIFEDAKPDVVVHHAAQISVSSSVKDPFHDMDIVNQSLDVPQFIQYPRYGLQVTVELYLLNSLLSGYQSQPDFPAQGSGIIMITLLLQVNIDTHVIDHTIGGAKSGILRRIPALFPKVGPDIGNGSIVITEIIHKMNSVKNIGTDIQIQEIRYPVAPGVVDPPEQFQLILNLRNFENPLAEQSLQLGFKDLPPGEAVEDNVYPLLVGDPGADGGEGLKTSGTNRVVGFQTLQEDFVHQVAYHFL